MLEGDNNVPMLLIFWFYKFTTSRDTSGFTEMGHALHSAADTLVHAAFKQQIVSQEELHKEMIKLNKSAL